jgi:hypothetical protein
MTFNIHCTAKPYTYTFLGNSKNHGYTYTYITWSLTANQEKTDHNIDTNVP